MAKLICELSMFVRPVATYYAADAVNARTRRGGCVSIRDMQILQILLLCP